MTVSGAYQIEKRKNNGAKTVQDHFLENGLGHSLLHVRQRLLRGPAMVVSPVVDRNVDLLAKPELMAKIRGWFTPRVSKRLVRTQRLRPREAPKVRKRGNVSKIEFPRSPVKTDCWFPLKAGEQVLPSSKGSFFYVTKTLDLPFFARPPKKDDHPPNKKQKNNSSKSLLSSGGRRAIVQSFFFFVVVFFL